MNSKIRIFIAVVAVGSLLTSCATQSDKIQTAYVSPVQYRHYDCDQLAAELERVTGRALRRCAA